MKAVNFSHLSPSLLNSMIPQFQPLLPLGTSLSGNCLNHQYNSELLPTTHKLLSPPISITPPSVCTDIPESECQRAELTPSTKYRAVSPPLSNIKSESIDFVDCKSPYIKQESTMTASDDEKSDCIKIKSFDKANKQSSNFTIDYILSSSYQSPTYKAFRTRSQHVSSIFTKKRAQSFSDKVIRRTIRRKKQSGQPKRSRIHEHSVQPRGAFLRCVLNLCQNLIHRKDQIKARSGCFTIDALEQLADLACRLDTRHHRFVLNENKLTVQNYDLLLRRCRAFIKQINEKYRRKKRRKRLHYEPKVANLKNRFLHFAVSVLNILYMERHFLLHGTCHSEYHILMSGVRNESILSNKTNKQTICSHLKADQITSNLEILLPNNGLLYEAVVQKIDSYDELLLIRLHRERQMYLIPVHDLCRLACPKTIPSDLSALSKGSRVCAYWSTSLRGLHPATVKTMPSASDESVMVGLLFDDGDTGLIKLDEIRLLPDNFNVKGIQLDEWRVSSSQIPSASSMRTRRNSQQVLSRTSSSTDSPVNKLKKEKRASSSSVKVPTWTLNTRTSTICRNDRKQTIRIGDCVILHGVDESLSYIGKVLKFYRNKSTQEDLVRLKWYYSPQETPVGLHKDDLPGALYESTHIDENPIATIRYKGTIFESYDDYRKKTDYGKKRQATDFYLIGQYNPTSGELKRYDETMTKNRNK